MNPKLAQMVALLLQYLPKPVINDILDDLLDKVENYVTNSPSKIDDVVLVLCKGIRATLNIPEGDD